MFPQRTVSLLLRRVGIEDSERSGCIYCARIEMAAALVNRPGAGILPLVADHRSAGPSAFTEYILPGPGDEQGRRASFRAFGDHIHAY